MWRTNVGYAGPIEPGGRAIFTKCFPNEQICFHRRGLEAVKRICYPLLYLNDFGKKVKRENVLACTVFKGDWAHIYFHYFEHQMHELCHVYGYEDKLCGDTY